METRFKIGQQYFTRGKRKDICTVIDILTTTNNQGEVVKIRYVSTHDLMGQVVTDYDVCDSTIKMGACEVITDDKKILEYFGVQS